VRLLGAIVAAAAAVVAAGMAHDTHDAGDRNGIFDVRVALPTAVASAVRFHWLAPDSGWQVSPSVAPVEFSAP
jgi:hypothetical protein